MYNKINENDIKSFGGGIRARHLIIENLMAVREACTLLGIKGKEVDDIFYNSAALIYGAEG